MKTALFAAGLLMLAPAQRSRDLILARSDAPAGLPIYTGSHLLVVGINDYKNLPPSAQLKYAVNDATEFRQVLLDGFGFRPTDVKVLTNGQATLGNIRKALEDLADPRRVKSDDRIIVYFSGHGQTVRDDAGVERGFLIPHDAKVSLESPNLGEFRETCLPMQEVWDRLDPSPAKHITIIADSCFSGQLTKSRGFYDNEYGLSTYLTMPARQAITGGGSGQKTWEADEYRHGVFTYNLINELKKRAQQKQEVFPVVDLFASVLDPVVRMSKGRQTPQYNAFYTEGQMLFFSSGESSSVRPETLSARLSVTTRPRGATVSVDGDPAGASPVTKEFRLSDRMTVKVRAEMEGYEPAEREVQVNPGKEAKVDLTLKKLADTPKKAHLLVSSTPPGATVLVDGVNVGKTPLTLDRAVMRASTVNVRLLLDGYQSAEQRTTLEPGKEARVTLTLSKTPVELPSPVTLASVCTLRPSAAAREVLFSPDGKQVAVYGEDRSWSFFEVPSGRQLRRIEEPADTYVRLTKDWKHLAYITLLSNGTDSWASLLLQDAKNDKSGRVLSAGMPQCVRMNYAWLDGSTAILCGQTEEGAGVVTSLDLKSGRADCFTITGRLTSGVASGDGQTLALFRDAQRDDVAVNLILMRGPGRNDQKQIPITDSDYGESVHLGSGTVAVNSAKRVGSNMISSRGFRVFDARTGEIVFASPRHEAIGYLQNGSRLLAWSQGALELFDAKSGASLGKTPSKRLWLSGDGRFGASQETGNEIAVCSLTLRS